MAIIVNTFGDNALQMVGEEVGNTLQIGNNWTHLRLGVLLQISGTISSSAPNGSVLSIGLTSGTGSLIGSAGGPAHFVGLTNNANSLYTPQNNSGYTIYCDVSPTVGKSCITTQVSGTITKSSVNLTGGPLLVGIFSGSYTPTYFPIYLDFIKSGSIISTAPQMWQVVFTGYEFQNYTSTGHMPSVSDFYAQLPILTSSYDGSNVNGWSVQAFPIPVSESINGILDSINIRWSYIPLPLHVHEIAVYRFA